MSIFAMQKFENMEHVSHIAAYIVDRYFRQFGEQVDEMKLQKLLYLVQREAIVRTGQPMFDAEFRAWKYGPVVKEVHDMFQTGHWDAMPSESSLRQWKVCLDYVFEQYAGRKTMSLVSLSHCESSWKRAREGYGKYDCSDVPMKMEDIYEDAARIKKRRAEMPFKRNPFTTFPMS